MLALDVARLAPPWLRDRTGSVAPADGATPATVTFPTTPLNFRVQIGLSVDYSRPWWEWNWADITQYVRWTPTIAWSTGRPDEASSVDTGTGSLTLDNTDGRFSRRNPYGPYYGLLTKNTPIWIQADPGSGFVTLLQHYVNEWPSRWDQSRNDATVPIATAGILRRLQQGSVIKSPLRQTVLGSAPYAYWPMEDGADATFIASGLTGGTPITPTGGYTFTFVEGPSGSAGALDLVAPAGVTAAIAEVTLASTTQFQVEFAAMSDSAALTVMLQIQATADNLSTNTGLSAASADGQPHYRTVTFTQSGSDVVIDFYVDGVFSSTTTSSSTTIKPTIQIYIAAGSVSSGVANLSHLSVRSTVSDSLSRAGAVDGYSGEQAHVRVARVCAEENIPFIATAGSSVAMGPQPVGTALEIFRDCEIADLGSLYETAFGLGYQSHADRDNALVLLTLDMDQGHVSTPPEPTDDDQGVVNRFTASRSGGSEATYEQTTGPMGTGAGGPGLYDNSGTPNVETDDQLLAYASAQVVRGTRDEDRWPAVPSNFAATPDLIPDWLAMQPFGARINIANPPDQMAPDTIDAFIDGYAMAVTPIDWDVALNTSPASSHRVFVLAETTGDNNPNLGYMIPTTCVLAEDLDTTETGVDITTDPLWTTAADDWTPGALITVGGEDMTVTAVSGGSNPQTLTVTRSVNSVVKSHSAGATVAFKYPGFLAL